MTIPIEHNGSKDTLRPRPPVIVPNNSTRHKRKLATAVEAAALAAKIYSLDTIEPGVKTPRTIRCISFKRRKTGHGGDEDQELGKTSTHLLQRVPITVASTSAYKVPVSLSMGEDANEQGSPPPMAPSPEELDIDEAQDTFDYTFLNGEFISA
ncbi:hypothetical protein VNI00_016487 [Paramarasmius palmivorus]|uniref:Uncharacterized protein n=1 Tax=Paramarasmius palmivorus TaxID=297713 RepID=A0AAW0BEQ3_9AGAR